MVDYFSRVKGEVELKWELEDLIRGWDIEACLISTFPLER